jgi:hypothetical protein
MSSIKALKKKISKRAKQKKNIQVKNSIRLKQAKLADLNTPADTTVSTDIATDTAVVSTTTEQQ